MATAHEIKPAVELAKINGGRFPNESVEYCVARDALLAEEISLRRHMRALIDNVRHEVEQLALAEICRASGLDTGFDRRRSRSLS